MKVGCAKAERGIEIGAAPIEKQRQIKMFNLLCYKIGGTNYNMSMRIERANIHQAIQTLPDNFLPDLAEFVIFLHKKAQQKIDVWSALSNQIKVSPTDVLEKAAQTLLDDYTNDKELTALCNLDGEVM